MLVLWTTQGAPQNPAIPPLVDNPVVVDDALRARIAQGGLAFGVPMTVGVAWRQAAGPEQLQLGAEVSVPVSTPRPLTVLYALVDRAGRLLNAGRRVVTNLADTDAGRLTFTMPAAPGLYRLRVAAADASGRIGSTETDVAGFLTQAGSLRVSDVLVSWSRADGPFRFLGLEETPPGTTSIRVSVELYPEAAAPAPLAVRFSLSRESESAPPFAQEVTPAAQGRTLAGSATIPLSTIATGTYTLRATIVSGATVLGSVSRPLRVP